MEGSVVQRPQRDIRQLDWRHWLVRHPCIAAPHHPALPGPSHAPHLLTLLRKNRGLDQLRCVHTSAHNSLFGPVGRTKPRTRPLGPTSRSSLAHLPYRFTFVPLWHPWSPPFSRTGPVFIIMVSSDPLHTAEQAPTGPVDGLEKVPVARVLAQQPHAGYHVNATDHTRCSPTTLAPRCPRHSVVTLHREDWPSPTSARTLMRTTPLAA